MDDLEQLIASSTMASASIVASTAKSAVPAASTNNCPWLLRPVELDMQDDITDDTGTTREQQLLAEYMASEEPEDVHALQAALAAVNNSTQQYMSDSDADDESDFDEELREGMKSTGVNSYESKFQQTIRRVPQQVMRYDFEGEPLLRAALASDFSVPSCLCGAQRCFEMQLLPTVINFMKISKDAQSHASGNKLDLDNFDFGNAIVWVCPNSCECSDTEFIFVQPPIA